MINATIDGCEKRPYTSLCTVRLENCGLAWGRDKNFSLCCLVHTGSGVQPVAYPEAFHRSATHIAPVAY